MTTTLKVLFIILPCIQMYEIAPITDDMREASDAIVANLLPPGGVTQQSSVAWSRLAYITGFLSLLFVQL